MTRETAMICDSCSRVIDGVSSALTDTLQEPSGDDAVNLCDWCVDDQPQDAPVFKPGKPIKPTMMREPDIEQVSRIMNLERAAGDLRMCNQRLECEVARLEGVIEGMTGKKDKAPR